MTSLFTDYGYGGEIFTTNKPDKFTVIPDNRAERLAYEASQHVETILITASRLDYVADRIAATPTTAERLEGLKLAARDCEQALAAVIAKLCREPDYGKAADELREVA